MTLKRWLKEQGFPHGMECVGEIRLQQLWDAAQVSEREECARICDELDNHQDHLHPCDCAEHIRQK